MAVGAGDHIVIIYDALAANPQSEIVTIPFRALALTLGDFIWDRDGRSEISVLTADGNIHILQHGSLDTRPLAPSDNAGRRAATVARSKQARNPTSQGRWKLSKQLPYMGLAPSGPVSPSAFSSPRLAAAPTYDLMAIDAGRNQVNILDTSGSTASSSATASFPATPVAALALPKKINGERDIVVLTTGQIAPTLLPADTDISFVVSTVNDEDDAGSCSNASTVTSGPGSDGVLSLREAVCEANNNGAVTSVINVPPGTFSLTISAFGGNGTGAYGGELQLGTAAGANISIVGTGTVANTVIQQTNGIDRVFEQDQLLVGNVSVSISNVTLSGGAPSVGVDAEYGGGAILGGGSNGDDLSIVDTVMSNNITASAQAGGALNFAVANLTVANSIFANNTAVQSVGGACACGSGDGQGNLVFTNSTFTNNLATDASSLSPPGNDFGGALYLTPGVGNAATVSGSAFSGNQAPGPDGQGGAIYGSGLITVTNSRIVGNSAAAVFIGGPGSADTAVNNWWGCNAGPNSAGCDSVSSAGIVSPWLVLGISASSTQVLPNGSTTLTADLTHNVDGAGGFDVPDGTAVAFGATLGTDNPVQSTTTSGQAISLFTAGPTAGAGSATTTVDNQTVSVSLGIGQSPAITSANNAIFRVGAAGAFSVDTTGSPNPSIAESGVLPVGVTFIDNGNGMGTLSGTPSPGTGGLYIITFIAQNGLSPSATQTFTLTVNQAPTITSAKSATFAIGAAGSFTVTTSAFPTASIREAGTLPSGVTFVDNHNGTGTLSGTPDAGSVFNITFTASNNFAPPAIQNFKLTLGKAPTVTGIAANPNPSTFGQSVAFTATVSSAAGTPTGTVTFTDGTTALGTVPLTGGMATLSTSTLGVGAQTISAVYNGGTNFSGSTSSKLSQVVNKAATTITLVSSPNPSTFGQSVAFTATVSSPSAIPTGTVTFKSGGTTIGTATLAGGVGTLTMTTLSVGTLSMTAVYNGSSSLFGSTSARLSQAINKAATTITLASSPNPSDFAQQATFTATVSSASATPTGTVTFKNGSTTLGTVTLAGGLAILTTTTLSAGTLPVTAVYNGNSSFSGSTSSVLSQVVNQATTTVALGSSPNPSAFGQSVTLTATVSSPSATPTGTVTFKNGSATLGTLALAGGTVSLSVTNLSVGTHSVTAVYNGSANFSGSTSSVLSQVVNQAATTIALASSPNPSAFGQSVKLTATVSSSSSIPTGTVTFKNGGATLGTVALAGGAVSLSVTNLSVGTHSVTAVYNGSASFSGSTSSVLGQVVNQATTTVALVATPNPSAFGQPITLTASVAPEFSGTPTSSVTFMNGNAALGTVNVVGGVATLTTKTLGVGTQSMTAVYNGGTNFGGSTSSVLSQVVNPAATTTALASSLNPSTFGQSVTFTATVSSPSGIPTGTVSFSSGSVTLGGAILVGGVATLATSLLTSGTLSITSNFAGSTNFTASSATLTQTVNSVGALSYTLAATGLDPSWFTPGSTSSSTITVTPANGYSGAVTLSCNIISGGTPAPTCSFNPASILISATAPVTSTLTVSTSSSTPATNYSISVTGSDANNLTPSNGPQLLTLPAVPAGSLDYILSASALSPASFTSGSAATSTITVTPANGYTGAINFSCNVVGGGTPAPSCSFSPSSVALSGAGAGTSILTVSTLSGTPAGSYTISVGAADANNLAPINGPQGLSLTTSSIIQHIVVIFQENRTPDNLFQDPVLIAAGADIASSGLNAQGQTVPLTPIDLGTVGPSPQNYDLGHKHADFVTMYDGGKMDGAPAAAFRSVIPSDVQPYFALAEQYTFADRMFQTNQGPSFPAHQFIISGTSAPTATSSLFAADNPTLTSVGDPVASAAGCIAMPTNLVTMVDATGSETNSPPEYPCFEHPTLTDLLDAQALSWRYYTISPGAIWSGPDAIDHICQPQAVNGMLTCTGPIWNQNVAIPQTQVLTDIANGQLAQVSWVIPDGTSSDHALLNDGSGPDWVASIVNAIGNSPYWANTAIIITWDDWGGWYDHVAPTVISDGVSWGSGYVYGFRVPLIVVSPYAKAAYISHVAHDFGSIIKFIEYNFNLPSLGYADGPADNLSDCFNLTQAPITFQAIPAALDAAHFINDKRPPIGPDDD